MTVFVVRIVQGFFRILFFAEVRYHLAIAALMFPYAAFALTSLRPSVSPASSSSPPLRRPPVRLP